MSIAQILTDILAARYGRDVRQAIHDGIEVCYSDVSASKTLADTAASNANTKATLADTAATNANAKATLADTAATNANAKATLADTAATNANEAATLVDTAASNANAKATLADTAASNANTKATLADTAATNANEAATNANAKAALADTAASNANEKATLADTAATNANAKATLADTAATNANAKATLADTAATNANEKATLADTAATNANTKATLANTAASNANTKATLADTAATNANAKATLADTAASNANEKATLADTAATNASEAASNANEKATLADTAATNANAKATLADAAATNANAKATLADTAATNANAAASDANDAAEFANSIKQPYIHIKYSAVQPTTNADMTDIPSDWMGIYTGISMAAPVDYTSYKWYNTKGATGTVGNHVHGSIDNDGSIGDEANRYLVTGEDGIIGTKKVVLGGPNLVPNSHYLDGIEGWSIQTSDPSADIQIDTENVTPWGGASAKISSDSICDLIRETVPIGCSSGDTFMVSFWAQNILSGVSASLEDEADTIIASSELNNAPIKEGSSGYRYYEIKLTSLINFQGVCLLHINLPIYENPALLFIRVCRVKLDFGNEVLDWCLSNYEKKPQYTPEEIGAATEIHEHYVGDIADFPTSMPASDVSAWAKAASKPSYVWDEIGSKPTVFTPDAHTHLKAQITDFPTSMPASDVSAWAKASTKPGYTHTEVGAAAASHGNHVYTDLNTNGDNVDYNTLAYDLSKVLITQPIHTPNYTGQTNAPIGAAYGALVTFSGATSFPAQFAFGNDSNRLRFRCKYGNTNNFGTVPWREVIHDGNFLNYVHPVGSVYMSVSSTSPATLFGGAWSALPAGRFLRAGTGGAEGGSDTHVHGTPEMTLTIAQIPYHRHVGEYVYNPAFSGAGYYAYMLSGNRVDNGVVGYAGGGGSHGHGNTYGASNVPAYYEVYAWRRTA